MHVLFDDLLARELEEIAQQRARQYRTDTERYATGERAHRLHMLFLDGEKLNGEVITKLTVTPETFGEGFRVEMELFRPYVPEAKETDNGRS